MLSHRFRAVNYALLAAGALTRLVRSTSISFFTRAMPCRAHALPRMPGRAISSA